MHWFRPNVSALLRKEDYQGLGKLLRHKDKDIRRASAEALLALLQKTCGGNIRVTAPQITSQFKGLSDNDIIALLMGAIEKLPVDRGCAYNDHLIVTVLLAGGVKELIAFNKRISPVLSEGTEQWRENMLNASISRTLVAYALARKFGIKELVDIIPYAVVQNEQEPLALKRALERSDVLTLPKEEIANIRERLARLPPNHMGLENVAKTYLARALLAKLQAPEDQA